MKNILSYKPGTYFSGQEIKNWIEEQLKGNTSHKHIAHYMIRFLNIKDDREYFIRIEDNYEHHASCKQRCARVYRRRIYS